MGRRPLAPRLGILAIAALAAGCILFVNDDPSKLSTTCHFQGEDSPCSRCAVASCSAELATCCGDATCLETYLPLLSNCAVGIPSLCQGFLAEAPALASCVTTACSACGAPDGGPSPGLDAAPPVPVDAGSTSCSKTGDSCFCSVSKQPNGAVCNTHTLPGPGLCCASYGWPTATDATCNCEPFSCTPNTSGAMCSLGIDSTGTTTWGGDGCCTYGSFCECTSSTSCSSPVTQCDVSTVGCDSSQVQVTSCSF